jgi:hypothetical protein
MSRAGVHRLAAVIDTGVLGSKTASEALIEALR